MGGSWNETAASQRAECVCGRERAGPCEHLLSLTHLEEKQRESFSLKSTSGCPKTAAADWTRLSGILNNDQNQPITDSLDGKEFTFPTNKRQETVWNKGQPRVWTLTRDIGP